MSELLFAIDTEQYAGNFEREMCAYVTGHVGECAVGAEAAAAYVAETGRRPLDFVEDRPTGDNDVFSPCDIYPTPGWFNHGMGGEKYHAYLSVAIFVTRVPADEDLRFMKERANKFLDYCQKSGDTFAPKQITITGFRIVEVVESTKETAV